MLQKIKYANIDYGKYERLQKKFQHPDFNPHELDKLDLSHQNASILPNIKCMELLTNLKILVLCDNLIARFDAKILTKCCPQLEWIDFSNNRIDVIDDLIDLGQLEKCQAIDIQGNPLIEHMKWVNILKNLLYPVKFKPYDPVRILTADYHAVPNQRVDDKQYLQQKKDNEIVQKHPDELEPHEYYIKVSKYNHKKTLGKFALQPCPIPRKSRFKNLTYLNNIEISLFDVMRVSGFTEPKDIVEEQNLIAIEKTKKRGKQGAIQILPVECQKWLQKKKDSQKYLDKYNKEKQGLDGEVNDFKLVNGKITRQSEEMHDYYLNKYKNKIKKQLSEAASHIKAPPKEPNEDELDYLMRLDLMDMKKIRSEIDPRKYAADIWQVPLDVQYKDSEYKTSIKEYKKLLQDYKLAEEQEKKKEEERQLKKRKKQKYVVNKKLEKMGFGKTEEFPSELDVSDESDFEIKKLFKKKKKIQPKLNLDQESEKCRTSDTSLNESSINKNPSLSAHSDAEKDKISFIGVQYKSFMSDKERDLSRQSSVDAVQQNQQQSKKEKKKPLGSTQEEKEAPILDLMKRVEEKKKAEIQVQKDKEKADQIKKQKAIKQKEIMEEKKNQETNLKYQKEKKEDELELAKQTFKQNIGEVINTHYTEKSTDHKYQLTDKTNEDLQTTMLQQQKFISNGIDSYARTGTEPQERMRTMQDNESERLLTESNKKYQEVPVQSFEFNYQRKKPISSISTSQIKKHDQKSFQIKNKVFFNQQNVNKKEFDRFSDVKSKRPLTRQNNEDEKDNQNIKRPQTSLMSSNSQPTNFKQQTKIAPTRKKDDKFNIIQEKPKVIVTGNLDIQDFIKSDIPLEDLIPNENQGLDKKFQQIYLYDPKSVVHQQLKYYKKTLDEARDIRAAQNDLDKKIQITSMKKKPIKDIRDPLSFKKVVDYLKTDSRINIQGSYAPAEKIIYQGTRKQPYPKDDFMLSTWDLREIIYKANDYDISKEPKITEKEINEILKQKDLKFDERIKVYEWQDILEDIKLKKTKTNDALISRMEKKEMKQAESNAQLAYHYQRLKKYLDPHFVQQQLKQLGIQTEDYGKIKFKRKSEEKIQIGPIDNRLLISHNFNNEKEKQEELLKKITLYQQDEESKKEKDPKKKLGFHAHNRELQKMKSEPRPQYESKPIQLQGSLKESIPNINEIINKKKYVPPSMKTFEQMVQESLRKNQESFMKQDDQAISIEQQMMRYAKEFEKKVENREILNKEIRKHIQNNQQKLEEFRQWDKNEIEKRYDKDLCFKNYVKQKRDGKIPTQP